MIVQSDIRKYVAHDADGILLFKGSFSLHLEILDVEEQLKMDKFASMLCSSLGATSSSYLNSELSQVYLLIHINHRWGMMGWRGDNGGPQKVLRPGKLKCLFDEVKKASRSLALWQHPDNPGGEAEIEYLPYSTS